MSEYLQPPPTSEREEIERRARITLRELVEWYQRHKKPLDVPLQDYEPKGK